MPLSPPISSWQQSRHAGKRTARSATPRSCASVRARRSSIGSEDVYAPLGCGVLGEASGSRAGKSRCDGRADGAGPATAINDLGWIGVVLRATKSVKEIPVNPEFVQQARRACRELRLIAKPRKRTRRPTAEELTRLRIFFKGRDERAEIPMADIMDFAITSARRESEICRLERRDNDPTMRTGLVRDAKHPTSKDGNHRRFKYTPGILDYRGASAPNEPVHLSLRSKERRRRVHESDPLARNRRPSFPRSAP